MNEGSTKAHNIEKNDNENQITTISIDGSDYYEEDINASTQRKLLSAHI